MDSGWESKTKIEKAFFIILSSFRSRLVFVKNLGPSLLIKFEFFFSKYDFLGAKKNSFKKIAESKNLLFFGTISFCVHFVTLV